MSDVIDQNTVAAPLRINSSARLAIILSALGFFALVILWLMLKGTPTNGLHQTLLTGALWIVGSVVSIMEAPTAMDSLRAFLVKQ